MLYDCIKARKREKIRNRYNEAPHLTKDTNGKATTSQLDITNESHCGVYEIQEARVILKPKQPGNLTLALHSNVIVVIRNLCSRLHTISVSKMHTSKRSSHDER